jgi:hypothetical protein
MKKKQSIERRRQSPTDATDAATKEAKEAANAKAEELRAALQSKSEQGKSSLGSLPVPEDKKSRERSS